MEQVKCSYSNLKKSYNKLPGSAGIKGSLYQIDLLTLVLLNGMQKIKSSWRLSTEDKAAAQLDDLVFELLPSGPAILLQAKHIEDETKEVTYKDLISVSNNSKFGLPKYFFSYQEVKSKFNVQTVVICTNLKLDEKTKSILKEESVDSDSVLLFEGADNICYGFSGASLPKLKQSIETYHAKNMKKKKVIISDEDINDFLNHLKFFPNCLGQKTVDNIIQQTISRIKFSENLNINAIQIDIHKKMTDWFKENRGRYLTEVEAKAFFCDMRSNKYCEDLKLYDVRFKRNNLPLILQTQQRNEKNAEKSRQQNASDPPAKDPKRISHIIPDKEYVLNVVKICQALPTHHKDKTLFVNPEDTVETQRETVDAFEVKDYTILVMVCPNAIEKTSAKEMCDKVMTVLNTHKYKHVILIAEENNCLAIQLKGANISYEVITDNITFADLEETTQREFKRRKLINFQGNTMSLEELFPPSSEDGLNQTVNSDMLVKLARGRKSEVGLELPRRDKYYIGRSFNRNGQNISEEDLWRSTEASEEKVVLICDSAGMGKSSVITSLAISLKRRNPHLWMVRFDLSNYTNIMKMTLAANRKSISIIEMLNSQQTSKLNSEFDEELFTTPKRVVLMLDGVDEISPTYTELVINLIKDSLAQVNLAKIFVTARPHVSKDFKEISKLQSFTLQPFSKDNQIDFLIKYWTETLDLQDDVMRTNKCKIFAETLIENMSAWIKEDRNNFAGIPLQTRMLAEIFQERNEIVEEEHDWEGCKEFSSSNNDEPKLPTRIDLTELYKLFIEKKRDIFIRNGNPSGHPLTDDLLKDQFEKCTKFHCRMALEVIFDSDEGLNLFTCYTNHELPIPSTFEDNFLFRIGIVQRQGGHVEFLHRTFAEYFATDCLLIELEREPVNEKFQKFFMSSILVKREFYVIRAFLDSRMRDVWHLMENNFYSYFRLNDVPNLLFRVFAEEGCARMLDCFIKCIDEKQLKILSKSNWMFYALQCATRYGHLNILKLLLELNEAFNKGRDAHKQFLAFVVIYSLDHNFETFKFLSRQVDQSDIHVLGCADHHEAVLMGRFGNVELWVEKAGRDMNMKDNIRSWTTVYGAVPMSPLEVVKFLVEEVRADINVKDTFGMTALHIAACQGELEIVKYLVEEAGADINVKDDGGMTALNRAARTGKLEIVKYLVEEAGADINVKDDGGMTALHRAAYWGRLEIVKYLVEEAEADINVKDDDGMTALHNAAYRGELEIVKYLVEEAGADINVKDGGGMTALHIVACQGELEIVKYLVEEAEADINVKDDDGMTALNRAARTGKLEIVKYLVEEAEADINVKDDGGMTALHRAAYWGRLEIVKYLVEEAEADINVKDDDGMTALHNAAYRGELEIVKYLVEEAGADINVKDGGGMTALHIVAYKGKLEIVKYLVEEAEADINVKDDDGMTALHNAARTGKLEIVKYLVEEAEADINVKDDGGMTALHRAAYWGRLEIVKYLVEEAEADINVKDDDGMTALHNAAYRGELEIVKYLVEEAGADINVKDGGGMTALHIVAYKGKLEIVKYLVEEAEADINVKDGGGMTALHNAARTGKLEIVKYLVEEAEADINVKDVGGMTALHRAAYWGRLEIVKYLVEEAGADINVKDDDGMTALHRACKGHELEIIKYLVDEAGADINVTDNKGKTALSIAADEGRTKVVKFLSKSNPCSK